MSLISYWSVANCFSVCVFPQKAHLLESAQKQVSEIQQQYNNGVITDGERYNKVVDIWAEVQDQIGSAVIKGLSTQVFGKNDKGETITGSSFNPIFIMADSGAAVRNSRFANWRDCAA